MPVLKKLDSIFIRHIKQIVLPGGAAKGYPYKINPIALGRQVYM